MADDYDFQINDLKFRAAINDQLPYQRATAPFRKEQFDSAPTVGDQSLTGWWTRGQLSFHGGAGVKFYEVLEGETVLNTWLSGRNVDPEPGQLRIAPVMTTAAVANIRDVVQVTNLVTNYFLFAKTDGTLTVAPELSSHLPGTETTFSSTGTVNALTAAPGVAFAWVADGTAVKTYQHGSASLVTQFTHSAEITHLWHMKRRLWFVDADGYFYMVASDRSTATTTGDSFHRSVEFSSHSRGDWKAAETPGAIFLARDNLVWSITIDESVAVPTPTPPVLASALPSSDTISSLGYLLGHLVIPTVKGVRFAQVNGTQVVYGQAVATEVDFSASVRVASRDEHALVVGKDVYLNGSGVFAFDLGRMIAPLRPAYWLRHTAPDGDIGSAAGALAPGLLYAWFGGPSASMCVVEDGVWNITRSHSALAVLSTGFHRFGTLEKKFYGNVTVRATGSGGTIEVWRKDDPNDLFTRTFLGTATLPTDTEVTFPIGLSEPEGAMALEFVIRPDATDATKAPTLLGYQLKALPVPLRQRILKWPLMLADKIQLRRGSNVGKAGRAFADLIALESLESSSAVVTYTDHRTGETGSAYIDSVEFQSDTPSVRNSNGFGGAAYLTLRVLT